MMSVCNFCGRNDKHEPHVMRAICINDMKELSLYRVKPSGTRPGKVVFLTSYQVYDVDRSCNEWKVESFVSSHRRGGNNEPPETWFERERDLEKYSIY